MERKNDNFILIHKNDSMYGEFIKNKKTGEEYRVKIQTKTHGTKGIRLSTIFEISKFFFNTNFRVSVYKDSRSGETWYEIIRDYDFQPTKYSLKYRSPKEVIEGYKKNYDLLTYN